MGDCVVIEVSKEELSEIISGLTLLDNSLSEYINMEDHRGSYHGDNPWLSQSYSCAQDRSEMVNNIIKLLEGVTNGR